MGYDYTSISDPLRNAGTWRGSFEPRAAAFEGSASVSRLKYSRAPYLFYFCIDMLNPTCYIECTNNVNTLKTRKECI